MDIILGFLRNIIIDDVADLPHIEAARRDPLTGALNHGSIVETLEGQVQAARADAEAIGVALIDLDNFGLLDNTYGHPAGDHVLIEVVELLSDWMPPGATWGRYGPDEFLVITATGDAAALEPAVERLRSTLADTTLRAAAGERQRRPLLLPHQR